MRKLIIIVLALIIFSPAVNAGKESDKGLINDELDKVTIQLKWFHQFQFAGYYAAIEKGFYAEEGLDVKLRQRVAGTSHLNDVLQGRAQYGTADAGGLLIERLQGKPVVLLAQIFQHSPLVLVTREDSGIRAAKDLAGKRIIIDVVGHSDMPLLAMLLDTFGGLDAINIKPLSFNPKDLIDGKTDAYGSYLTNHPDWFRQQGVAVNIINPRDYGIDFYGDNLFSTENELREYPERVEKIRRATLKGWHYALENRDEIIELILKKYNTQGTNREHLAYEARETEKLILHDLIELGSFELGRYQKIANTYAKAGLVKQASLDPAFFYQTEVTQQQIKLSAEEQAWIAEHPVINVSNEMDWPPFDFVKDGQPTGFSIDYLTLVAEKVGLGIEWINGYTWNELEEMGRMKKLDLLQSISRTSEKETIFNFTKPYVNNPKVIFARSGDADSIGSLKDLAGKRVAVIKGFSQYHYLENQHTEIEIIPVGNVVDGLTAVVYGKADAYIDRQAVINYAIKENNLTGVQYAAMSGEPSLDVSELVFAVRDDWPYLVSIIEKGMSMVTEEEYEAISRRWFIVNNGLLVNLTEHERAWIAEHPKITLGFTAEIEPLLIAGEEGQLSGILTDIYDELESATGIKINIEVDEWSSTIQKAKDGIIDGLLVSASSFAEEAGLIHTHILTTGVPTVFARKDAPFEINSEKDLQGKKISVLKGVYVVNKAIKPYKDSIEIIETESAFEMMKMLSEGKVDVAYGLSYHNYLIAKHMLIGIEPVYFSHKLDANAVASIRAEWPEFVSIMNKVLDVIGKDGLNEINLKWTQLESEPGFQKQMQSLVSKEVDHLFSTLSDRLRSNINDLLSANCDGIPSDQDEHLAMVKHLSSSYPFLQSVNYIDADNRIQYISPVESNQKVIGLEIDLPAPLAALQVALASGQSVLSAPFEIIQGQMGYSLMTAHPRKGALEQVFRAEAVFGPNSSFRHQNKIALRVSDGGEVVYTSPDFRSDGRLVVSATGEIMGRHFQIEAITTTTLPLMLNEEERRWLWEHPEVILGTDQGWRPYVVVEKDGSVAGIEADLLERINALTGANIRIVAGKWSEMVEKANSHEIDGLAVSAYNKEREPHFLFTDSPYSVSKYIYTRSTDIKEMEDMVGKRVALLRGNRTDEKLMKRLAGIILVPVESNEDMVSLLAGGQVDAVIGGINFRMDAQEKMIFDIKIAFIVPDSETEMLYSIRKDWPELKSIINKALASMPLGERMAILEKWSMKRKDDPFTIDLGLSAQEKQWLDEHQEITMCVDPDWMPFEQINEAGEHEGLVSEYMDLIANRLGVRFELYPTENFKESLSKVSSGECMFLSSWGPAEGLKDPGLVTKPYMTLAYVLAIREEKPFIHLLQQIADERIGVVANYPIAASLKKVFPDKELTLVDNVDQGVWKVASGEIDVFASTLSSISYSIQKQKLRNVKIGGVVSGEGPVHMAVHDKEPILVSILDKAIDSITQEDCKRIADRWFSVRYERGFDYGLLWQILAVVTIVLSLFLYWNRRLSREVKVRKRAEVDLQKAREIADTANQAKSIFLANMSHEIRTPMNAILGFTEILKAKEQDSQKRHYIESIHSGGKALLSIINDILDLSKIEAGKIELQYSALSLSGLFQEMKTIFYPKTTDKGIEFIVESSENLPAALILDETRVRQVLINLLGNAVKFTDKGHIRLSVFCRSTDDKSCSRVELAMEVEDTGMGIPQDQQAKIFDAFEQVRGRKASQAGGTGLGLAITSNLVAMMNGEISVSSEPGKGSTFRFTLHDVEIAASRSMKEKEEVTLDFNSIAFEPATVLIVDDIDYNREMLATYLEGWDFNIIFATNGREAIDQARKHHPHIITLDMKMPEMDGYETSEIMNRDEKLKDIPVIAVTASAMKENEELILGLCDGYLRKPVSRAVLVREIMKHLPHTIKEIKEETPSKEAPSTELILPPPEQIKKLLEAAKMGSVTDMKESIAEIRDMDLKYQTFANKVEVWGRKFEFEEIVEFLQQHMEINRRK